VLSGRVPLGEDGGSMALRNVGTLPHHYAASQSITTQLASPLCTDLFISELRRYRCA